MLALEKLSIGAIVTQHRPKAANWPGLVLEISEDEIMQNLHVAQRVETRASPARHQLRDRRFRPRLFGDRAVKDLSFSELKIDRSFVANCDTDRMNAGLCETIIELAASARQQGGRRRHRDAAELQALHAWAATSGRVPVRAPDAARPFPQPAARARQRASTAPCAHRSNFPAGVTCP
jgi:hypothetical protein